MTEPHRLSEREGEVASLLLQGKANKQIAAALGVAVRTVEFHLSRIYRKLDVDSRTEAVLRLAETHLRESTVDVGCGSSENGRKPISRRIHMKDRPYIIVGSVLAVILAIALVLAFSSRAVDYHSDSEIAQQALASAAGHMSSTEMQIADGDPVHVGTVVLNQFLRGFRQRETHYAIRLTSYDIAELTFVEETDDQLYFVSIVRVVPQDRAAFEETLDGIFPYEETEKDLVFSLGFTVFRQGTTYKLVDIVADA